MKKQKNSPTPRVVYYRDALRDEFSTAVIEAKPIDAHYRYDRETGLRRMLGGCLYRLVAVPLAWLYLKCKFRHKVVGKDKYKNDILAMLSGPRFVAVATATLSDCATGESVSASSFAFVDAWRKGQTEPEKLCGSADSYASKYALGHLFALDNNRDADMESDGNGASAPKPQDAGPLPDGCDF